MMIRIRAMTVAGHITQGLQKITLHIRFHNSLKWHLKNVKSVS